MSRINSSTEDLVPATNNRHEALDIDSTNLDNVTQREPHEHAANGGAFGPVTNFQNKAQSSLNKYSKEIKYIRYITLYILLVAYFGWATQYFIDRQESIPGLTVGSTTCTGYGLFMIIFIFINFGIAYSWILKPYCLPVIKKTICGSGRKGLCQKLFQYKYTKPILFLLGFLAKLGFLLYDARNDYSRLMPLTGLVCYFIIGYLMCNNRGKINWRPVKLGIMLQFVFGLLTIRWDVGRNMFGCVGDKVALFLGYANEGAAFVYGDFLVRKETVFVFQALSAIFFLSFVVNILYHYGVMQKIILVLGQFLQAVMGTTICESTNSAANIFLGMTEAPLLIKPYLQDLTSSEIFSIMSTGFATVSGTVLAAYISFGASPAHLITASVMSAPAALCFTKLVYPETEETKATKESIAVTESHYSSALDAASSGATTALDLILGITANLIAFLSFVFFLNETLSFMGELVGYKGADAWTIERFAGYVFMPVSYTMGVPWDECELVGKLIGIKTIVNEFAAYKAMGLMKLRPRTKVIATYAICGFSNPGSIGIMISALSVLMPNRRELITKIVFKAFVCGAIICFMTACIAALLIHEDSLDL